MRPAASMSMLVGLRSIGERAHSVTSSPSGTVNMSSGTWVGAASCARAPETMQNASAQNAADRSRVMVMVMPSERIGGVVRVDDALLAGLAGLRRAVLHAEHARVSLPDDVPE